MAGEAEVACLDMRLFKLGLDERGFAGWQNGVMR